MKVSSKIKDAANEIFDLLERNNINYETCQTTIVVTRKEFANIFGIIANPMETLMEKVEIYDEGKQFRFQILRGLEIEDFSLDYEEIKERESEILRFNAKQRGESVNDLNYEQLWELEIRALKNQVEDQTSEEESRN